MNKSLHRLTGDEIKQGNLAVEEMVEVDDKVEPVTTLQGVAIHRIIDIHYSMFYPAGNMCLMTGGGKI